MTKLLLAALGAALLPGLAAPEDSGPEESGNAPAVLEVPFELVAGVPLVEVGIGEAGPFTMLVDTGTTPSGIDLGTALDLGLELPPEPSGEAAGSGDAESVPVYDTTIPDLRLGGEPQGDVRAASTDLSGIAAALGRPLHGVLGHGFLDGKVVELDYPARRLRLYATRPPLGADREHWSVPLVYRQDDVMPLVELVVNGERIRATLDTGASTGLTLYAPGVRLLGLEEAASAGADAARLGFRGRFSVREGEVDAIRLGPFPVQDTRVTFLASGADDATREGNFGGGILRELVLLIDYREGLVTFSRPSP